MGVVRWTGPTYSRGDLASYNERISDFLTTRKISHRGVRRRDRNRATPGGGPLGSDAHTGLPYTSGRVGDRTRRIQKRNTVFAQYSRGGYVGKGSGQRQRNSATRDGSEQRTEANTRSSVRGSNRKRIREERMEVTRYPHHNHVSGSDGSSRRDISVPRHQREDQAQMDEKADR